MTSIKNFPRSPISKRSTRSRISNIDYKKAHEWTNEYDLDDFVEIWKDKDKMPIFYRLINSFLLLINYNNDEDRKNFSELLKELKEYDEDTDTDIIIEHLLKNIIDLYITLQLFPSASRILEENKDLILYHGIENLEESLIPKIITFDHKNIFETPIFLSTSIIIDTACRFATKSKIILKIKVNKDDLKNFKYSYFGNNIFLDDKNSFSENEILLNIFTKLKFINIEEDVDISYKVPLFDGKLKEESNKFKIINFEFVNNSNKTPENVLYELKKIMKNYEKESMNGGKKTKKNKKYKIVKVPVRYLPKYLSKKDKNKQKEMLNKSRKLYKKGIYFTRKKVKSFKSKKSDHVKNAEKLYKVNNLSINDKLAKASGCSKEGLKQIVKKGEGAYYSSGSRPNQTPASWGYARLSSAITGAKSAIYDYKILENHCKKSSKALKLAKKAFKKYKNSTVKKIKIN